MPVERLNKDQAIPGVQIGRIEFFGVQVLATLQLVRF